MARNFKQLETLVEEQGTKIANLEKEIQSLKANLKKEVESLGKQIATLRPKGPGVAERILSGTRGRKPEE